jgi:hypothetical protein
VPTGQGLFRTVVDFHSFANHFAVSQRRCVTLARYTADSRLSGAFSDLFAPSDVPKSADSYFKRFVQS